MEKITNLSKIFCFMAVYILSLTSAWSQTCEVPTSIYVDNVTQVGGTLHWTPNSNYPTSNYNVEIRSSGAPGESIGLVSDFTIVYQSTSPTTFQFFGLNPQQTYSIYMQSVCSSSLLSPWSAGISFTTGQLLAPIAQPAGSISATSFVAKWSASVGADQYELFISTSEDFTNVIEVLDLGNVLSALIFEDITPSIFYYYKVRAKRGTVVSGFSNPITVETTTDPATVAIWENGVWSAEPTPSTAIEIKGNFNTAADQFGTQLLCNKLTLFPTFTFTIAPLTYVRISDGGSVINNSGVNNFIVESNGNLAQQGSGINTTSITVKRLSFPIYRLDYTMWSSPVGIQKLIDFSPLTAPDRFYEYNSTPSGDNFAVVDDIQNHLFATAKGYLIRAPNNFAAQSTTTPGVRFQGVFKGVPHNGEISIAVPNNYSLIGNPFPTDLNANLFVNSNPSLNGTLYFWRRLNNLAGGGDTGSFYATWTGFGGTGTSTGSLGALVPEPDGVIKVGQGFVVGVKDAGNVVFKDAMKIYEPSTDNFYKNTEVVERHKLWLNLTNTVGVFSQTLMGFASNAADGSDANDGKYIGDSSFALSSLLDGQAYTIQAKSLPFEVTKEFNLRLQTNIAGSFTISLATVSGMFDGLVDPLLVDMLSNTTTNLTEGSYTFATTAGVFDSRFKIVFQETALGTVDNAIDQNAIIALNNSGVLNINAGSYTINSVEIYDLLGRRIYAANNVDATATSVLDLKATQQVILVKIATDHGTVTKKVQF